MMNASQIHSLLSEIDGIAQDIVFDAVFEETGSKVTANDALFGWDNEIVVTYPNEKTDLWLDHPDAVIALTVSGSDWEFFTGREPLTYLIEALCKYFAVDDLEDEALKRLGCLQTIMEKHADEPSTIC